MRFGPSFSVAALPALTRRAAAQGLPPAEPRAVPEGLLTSAQASFEDLSVWTLDQPDWQDAGGAISKSPGAANRYATVESLDIPAGDIWVAYTVKGATAGGVGAQLQGPFANAPFMNRVSAHQVVRFQGPAHTRMRLIGNMDFDGTVEDCQVVDMTATLAQPSDIYIAAGQSLMAAQSQSTPVDPDLDFWVPRCLYIPGHTNATYGTVAGTVAACVAPLQMTQTAQGVSPITTFAREVEKDTAPDRTVMIVGVAQGSTRLVGDDAEWNPDGSTGAGGTLYAAMRDRTLAALARNSGNAVKGLIWAQGESDRSLTMDQEYPPAFANMVTRLRADLGVDLPVIIIGPMPDDDSALQPLFIQTQERLDQDSGHATAVPGVHYVARAPGYMSGDGTHPVPEGNRVAGRFAAGRFKAEGYL